MNPIVDLITVKNFIDQAIAAGFFKSADEVIKIVGSYNNIAQALAQKETAPFGAASADVQN